MARAVCMEASGSRNVLPWLRLGRPQRNSGSSLRGSPKGFTEAPHASGHRRERVADAVEKGAVLERLLDHAAEARMARASQKVARCPPSDQDSREFEPPGSRRCPTSSSPSMPGIQ